MKILKVQSISDVITNSSSEIFLVSGSQYIEPSGYDSWSYKIDFDFLCKNPDRDFIYDYLKIPNIIEGYFPDPAHPDAIYEEADSHWTTWQKNSYYIELLKEYIKDNQDLFDKVLGGYLVGISDHNFEEFKDEIVSIGSDCLASFGRY